MIGAGSIRDIIGIVEGCRCRYR